MKLWRKVFFFLITFFKYVKKSLKAKPITSNLLSIPAHFLSIHASLSGHEVSLRQPPTHKRFSHIWFGLHFESELHTALQIPLWHNSSDKHSKSLKHNVKLWFRVLSNIVWCVFYLLFLVTRKRVIIIDRCHYLRLAHRLTRGRITSLARITIAVSLTAYQRISTR